MRGRPLLPEGDPRHGERANGNHAASDEASPCEQAHHRPRSREPRTPTQAFSAHARPKPNASPNAFHNARPKRQARSFLDRARSCDNRIIKRFQRPCSRRRRPASRARSNSGDARSRWAALRRAQARPLDERQLGAMAMAHDATTPQLPTTQRASECSARGGGQMRGRAVRDRRGRG